jgi:membrane associated rhomboid family serine protease
MAAAAAGEELVKLPVGIEVLKPATEARNPDPDWTTSPVVLVLLLTLVLVSLISVFRYMRIKNTVTNVTLDQPSQSISGKLMLSWLSWQVYARVRRQRASSPASELWGISYFRVVGCYEAWRVFTSSFTHLQLPHLLLNAFGLWATRRCEWKLGSVSYLATTAVFMVISQVSTTLAFAKMHLLAMPSPNATFS